MSSLCDRVILVVFRLGDRENTLLRLFIIAVPQLVPVRDDRNDFSSSYALPIDLRPSLLAVRRLGLSLIVSEHGSEDRNFPWPGG